jgi:glutathionyl-hydroquinone reductase
MNYETLNNGVYRCRFATGKAIYEQAVTDLGTNFTMSCGRRRSRPL